MIAADIVHKEYCEIDANFNDINNLIVTIAKTQNTTGLSKAQIFSAKEHTDNIESCNKPPNCVKMS